MASLTLTRDELAGIVEEQVEAILRARGASRFSLEYQDLVDKHEAQIQGMLQDRSLGNVLNGPTWISGTSVLNGTITAPKLLVSELEAVTAQTGNLNVTGNITASASYPAVGQMVIINSTGIYGYNSTPAATFFLNSDGAGFIGIGATKIAWSTAGVVEIPVASIQNLTIANVGTGTIGGTYQTGASNPRMTLSTSGITATNSGGTTTFQLNATTGAITATGSFTIQSAASGARVVISNAGGIEGFNSSGTSTFLLNAATGAGRLGISGSGLSWDSAGAVSIDGSLLVTGTVTANKVTAGTINDGSAATINLGAADLVVNSTGKLKFGASSADYLSNNLLHFEVGTSDEAIIEWKNSTNVYSGQIFGNAGGTGATWGLYSFNSSDTFHRTLAFGQITSSSAAVIGLDARGGTALSSAAYTASSSGSGVYHEFSIAGSQKIRITSAGLGLANHTTDATAGALAFYVVISYGGTDYKVPFYAVS